MTEAFRAEFEAWWDMLVEEGERLKNPYLPDLALQERLKRLSSEDQERAEIDAILIDWLGSDDVFRWQPALGNLTVRHVAAAAAQMRRVAARPGSTSKKDFGPDFLANAQEIEDAQPCGGNNAGE